MVTYGDWVSGDTQWHTAPVKSQPLKTYPTGTSDDVPLSQWSTLLVTEPFENEDLFPLASPLGQVYADRWVKGGLYFPWDNWEYYRHATTFVQASTWPPEDGRPSSGWAGVEGINLDIRSPYSTVDPQLPPGAIGVEYRDGRGLIIDEGAPVKLVGQMGTQQSSLSVPPPPYSWRAGVAVMQGDNGWPGFADHDSWIHTWPENEPRDLGKWRSQGDTFQGDGVFNFEIPLLSYQERRWGNAIVVPTLEYVAGRTFSDIEVERSGPSPSVPPVPPQDPEYLTRYIWEAELLSLEVLVEARFPTYRFIYPSKGMWPYRQKQSLGASGYPYRQRQNGGNTGSHPYRQRQRGL